MGRSISAAVRSGKIDGVEEPVSAAQAARPDVFYGRALRGKLVASLAGVSPTQLAGWARREVLESPYRKVRPGRRRLYSWVDYQKARALAALRERGVSNRRLGEQVAQLDAQIEDWWKVSLSEFGANAIIRRADAAGYTIAAGEHATGDCLCETGRANGRVDADAELALDIVCALRRQGPLGRLCEFSEHVNMDPRIQDGYPVVRGRRIETEMLYILSDWGSTVDELAERFQLTSEQVKAAIAFERARGA